MNLKYSVLMSVYHKENPEWFRESIDSMLAQSVPPAEIVIVKDGPLTDELECVLDNYIQQWEHLFLIVELQENKGLGIALNHGVSACHYDIIVRMDTDDYADMQRVEKQIKAMEKYSADIVSSNIGEFQDTVKNIIKYKEVPEHQEELYRYAKRRNPFNHPAVIFKKEKVLEAGNYQKCDGIEDYDLWVRMLQMGCKGYNVQEPLVLMRVNENAYKRRGGYQYLKNMLAFNYKLMKSNWCSLGDFVIRSVANLIVCLIPNSFRDKVYKKMLRR